MREAPRARGAFVFSEEIEALVPHICSRSEQMWERVWLSHVRQKRADVGHRYPDGVFTQTEMPAIVAGISVSGLFYFFEAAFFFAAGFAAGFSDATGSEFFSISSTS